MTHDRFYELLKAIGTVRTFEPVHSTCDVLTASGDLKIIRDETLKSNIAKFFTLVERSDLWEQLLVEYQFNQFDTWSCLGKTDS